MRDAQRAISSREFTEWQAFAELQPFGEQRADLRSAIVACTMANAWRGKNEKTYRPRDFMPFLEGRSTQQSPEEMEAVLRSFASAHTAFEKQARKRQGP